MSLYKFGDVKREISFYNQGNTPVTVDHNDDILICNPDATASMTVNLPTIHESIEGKVFTIKNIGTNTNGVIVDADGSNVVETTNSFGTAGTETISDGDTLSYVADDTNNTWWLI